jgi:hypothetical protein
MGIKVFCSMILFAFIRVYPRSFVGKLSDIGQSCHLRVKIRLEMAKRSADCQVCPFAEERRVLGQVWKPALQLTAKI